MAIATFLYGCNSTNSQSPKESAEEAKDEMFTEADTLTKHLKPFNPELPTIGLLMYNGFYKAK